MCAFNDNVLRQMYRYYNIPCDRLISDQKQFLPFVQDYMEQTGQKVGPAQLAHRLLYLRKRGEPKGGLPRLRRSYNGRN